jgi:hypothetical protein
LVSHDSYYVRPMARQGKVGLPFSADARRIYHTPVASIAAANQNL